MPRVKTISDDQLLDSALDVLLEHGPQGFTLPEVGRAVGLSPSTLIQRFGSKRKLLDKVLDRATSRMEGELADRPRTGDPGRDLVSWLVGLTEPPRTRRQVAGNLTLLVEDITDDARRVSAARHMQVMRDGIAAYLTALGSPSPQPHAAMLEAHWHGLVIQWAMTDVSVDLDAWVGDGLEALVALLVPPESGPEG